MIRTRFFKGLVYLGILTTPLSCTTSTFITIKGNDNDVDVSRYLKVDSVNQGIILNRSTMDSLQENKTQLPKHYERK